MHSLSGAVGSCIYVAISGKVLLPILLLIHIHIHYIRVYDKFGDRFGAKRIIK